MAEPSFDEAALSSLTRRINAKLSASAPAHSKDNVKANKPAQPKGKSKKERLKNSNADNRQKSEKNRPTPVNQPNQKHAASKTALSSPSKHESKKHLRSGELKPGIHAQSRSQGTLSEDDDRLLKEILELGGTKEDLELIKDADSGSEFGSNGQDADAKLKKDLKNLVKELGISKMAEEQRQSYSEDDDAADSDQDGNGALKAAEYSNGNTSSSKSKAGSSRLLFQPGTAWHDVELPPIPVSLKATPLSNSLVDELHSRGKEVLQAENETYATSQKTSSAHQFYSTIMTSGTLTDKISALTLSVQESPLHNMRAFEGLLALAKKRSRAQAIEVLNALKDLFAMGSMIPAERHLRMFTSQPGLANMSGKTLKGYKASSPPPKPLEDAHLLLWAYEDWLKAKYFEMLQILETWLGDEILFSRLRAVDMTFELLREKPEQEANLLRLLVNKLGDREKKVASKASYNILQLQIPHPSMAANIISAIESDILFRPGQNLHAKYYAMITLNQTALSSKEETTVRKILDIYFAMFLAVLKDDHAGENDLDTGKNVKGEIQGGGGRPGRMAKEKRLKAAQKGASADEAVRDKIMSAVLTGINRALPFADTSNEFFERHLDTLFRVTHSANFNTSVQSLMLIQQLCESQPSAMDRFYRTLYESLLDPRLLTSSKQVLYLNLLYRALRADLSVKRIQAFAKRLLQCIAMHQPAFACGVLYLLRELEGVFPGLALLIDQPEEDAEDETVKAADAAATATTPDAGSAAASPPAARRAAYDGKKRAPEHSNAERTCLWELEPFMAHFHPSVNLFASRLMAHEAMPPKPDLDSHTLSHFLDRFVYRNPKKVTDKLHGASLMQPLAAGDSSGLLVAPQGGRARLPVNSDAFASMRADNVQADEVFFHKYFSAKSQSVGAAKAKKDKRKAAKAAEQASDDDEEAEIWQALVDSRPEIEGSDEEDEDADLDMDDFSDLEDDESADEAGSADFSLEDDDDGVELNFDDEDEDEEDGDGEDEDIEDGGAEEAGGAAELDSAKAAAKKRRKYLKSLPVFASADDYAAMMDNIEGEELAP